MNATGSWCWKKVTRCWKNYCGALLDDGKKILGRMDGTIPRDGELNPNIVARAFGLQEEYGLPVPPIVRSRPPSLCKGCPHIYSYNALNEALEQLCQGKGFFRYRLLYPGALEPYGAINTCVDMGASHHYGQGRVPMPDLCLLSQSSATPPSPIPG